MSFVYAPALGVVGPRYHLRSLYLFINCALLALTVAKKVKTAIPIPKVQGMETRRTRGFDPATPLCFTPLCGGKGLGAGISHHEVLRGHQGCS